MTIHNVEQGTPEWFTLRQMKLTASKAETIQVGGKGLETLCYELVAEKYSSADKVHFTNEHTERGNELEEQARQIYELQTGDTVEQVGFVTCDEYVGCSPDGLVGDEGLVEIKCPSDTVYLRYLCTGDVDKGYWWQAQMQMYVLDRKWCDLSTYNPNFQKSMIINRIVRDEEAIDKLKAGLEKGVDLLQKIESTFLSKM